MAIRNITEFRPASSGIPVSDAEFIRGGYFAVANSGELLINHTGYLNPSGQLAYSISDSTWYIRSSGSWSAVPRIQSTVAITVATGVWTLNHNLGYQPNIVCMDTGGNQIVGSIEHNSINQCTVHFNRDVAGTGYLS